MPKKQNNKPNKEWVDPWSEDKQFVDTSAYAPNLSPVSNRQMIEVLVGPAKGPKTRAFCRPDERICLPIKIVK